MSCFAESTPFTPSYIPPTSQLSRQLRSPRDLFFFTLSRACAYKRNDLFHTKQDDAHYGRTQFANYSRRVGRQRNSPIYRHQRVTHQCYSALFVQQRITCEPLRRNFSPTLQIRSNSRVFVTLHLPDVRCTQWGSKETNTKEHSGSAGQHSHRLLSHGYFILFYYWN